MKLRLQSIVPVLLALIVSPAAALGAGRTDLPSLLTRLGGGQPLPGGWHGVWQITNTIKDCQTLQTLFTQTVTDTICPDEDVFGDDVIDYDCTGTVTDTEFHLMCTASYEDSPGCTVSVSTQFDGTRSGNSFTSTGIVNTTFSAGCDAPGTFCARFEQTAARTSTSTSGCVVPVEATTWGRIKSRHP